MTTTQWARIMAGLSLVLFGLALIPLAAYVAPQFVIWAGVVGGIIAISGAIDAIRGGRH